ncbi:unnamed protein product [Durusdinium trenchii]|uniref:Uncharacterized protein n=1 Tax=Durusdinium trenchii TaxID=1381693 RepID=A0ABP0QY61_9DINO
MASRSAQNGSAENGDEASVLSRSQWQLLKGAAGIYFFFIWYGRLQEQIFKYKSPSGLKFNSVWFLQFLDALVNVAVGALGRCLEGHTALPQVFLLFSGVGQVLGKYCMSASLAVGLSFPVATMAKSAKMVPVMIGSLVLGSARFSSAELGQAAAIVSGTGLVSFAEGRHKKTGASTKMGIFFILSSLFFDGVVSGLQGRLKARCKTEKKKARLEDAESNGTTCWSRPSHQVHHYDLMFWTNLYMAGASLLFALARSEMREGSRFCLQNPRLAGKILKFATCGALGQACVFYTIAHFDSVVCSAITTTRKLLSVLISVAEGDGLPFWGWVGVAISSVGIAGQVAVVDKKQSSARE